MVLQLWKMGFLLQTNLLFLRLSQAIPVPYLTDNTRLVLQDWLSLTHTVGNCSLYLRRILVRFQLVGLVKPRGPARRECGGQCGLLTWY